RMSRWSTWFVRTASWNSWKVRKKTSSFSASTWARTRRSASSSKASLYTKYRLTMPYFGYSRYPMKVRTRSINRLVSSAFRSPSGRARNRSSSSCSFFHASRRPCSKRRSPAPGSKFLMLPRITGTSVMGRSLQRGLVMSISPTQRMPYLSRKARMASRASRPPVSFAISSRKPSSSTCCRKATTSGRGRITSATSRSASPISDATFAAIEDGLQRVPDQRIGLPNELQEAGAARWRSQVLGDVDEQPPAGHVHRPEGCQLPQGEPQGLHGVGHHLLMTDGDVDVIVSVAGHGDGEQCGNR